VSAERERTWTYMIVMLQIYLSSVQWSDFKQLLENKYRRSYSYLYKIQVFRIIGIIESLIIKLRLKLKFLKLRKLIFDSHFVFNCLKTKVNF